MTITISEDKKAILIKEGKSLLQLQTGDCFSLKWLQPYINELLITFIQLECDRMVVIAYAKHMLSKVSLATFVWVTTEEFQILTEKRRNKTLYAFNRKMLLLGIKKIITYFDPAKSCFSPQSKHCTLHNF